jgi:Cu+-exporting ATPase
MPTTTLRILGLNDDDDLRAVMNAIQDLPCIGDIDIAMDSGLASIEHSSMVAASDLRAAIEEAGFATD